MKKSKYGTVPGIFKSVQMKESIKMIEEQIDLNISN